MTRANRPSVFWLLLPLIAGFLTPSLTILAMDLFLGRKPVGEAIQSLASRQFSEGDNLFLLAAFGLIPFVLLSIILIFPFRSATHRARVPWLSVAGTIGALALMIPMHVGVWLPLYTGEHMSSTAVIAFVFIPFFCCLTMALGLLVGVLATRRMRAAAA